MDYSKWVVKSVPITRLLLDPLNPRLASLVKRPSQKELIEDLLRHEDVMTLVKDISNQGFFPNDHLVAVKEETGQVVLEGNRRLAALKLLHNPELAPDEFKKRVKNFKDHARAEIDKVQVVFAPSRDSAVPLIIARHNGEPVRKWNTIMQARFLQSRIDQGLSIDAVAKETGLDRSDIVKDLRDAKLYDVILSLPPDGKVSQLASDPHTFPFTTLRRLIDSPKVQNFLGMENDEKNGFVTTLEANRFQSAIGKIVTDIAKGDVTSRSHNTAEDVAKYVKKLEDEIGKSKPNKTTKTPATELIDPARVAPISKKTERSTKPQTPSVGIIPKGYKVTIDDDRIRAIAEELKSLRVSSFPNATAILFRSLLDMAVTKYMNDQGHLKKVIAKLSQKSPKPADWTPSLNQQLVYLKDEPTIPLNPEGRKSLQKFLTDNQSSLTMDVLNWFAHCRLIPPTEAELRNFWTMLRPLFDMTMQDDSQ